MRSIDTWVSEAMETIDLVVASACNETARVRSFVFRRPDGGPLPVFEAGAHVDVTVAGNDGQPLQRSYSLCCEPGAHESWRLGVLREDSGRGGSIAVHRTWLPGTRVRFSVPKNQFPLAASPLAGGGHHVLVAGGIGITPLLAMAHALRATGEEWALHYCARALDDAAFVPELARLAGARLHLHLDGGDPGRGLDVGGLISAAPAGSHVYVCGPRGLNEAVIAAAATAGWPRDRVHHEFFSAATPAAGDGGFKVRLQASGRCVAVGAKETVLDALLREDVQPLYDCKRGECGLCATTVVSGDIDHRDYVLSDADRTTGRQMCICVSRVRSGELVLDL
jgi:vanillate O-demethylase ferredoxin subunit